MGLNKILNKMKVCIFNIFYSFYLEIENDVPVYKNQPTMHQNNRIQSVQAISEIKNFRN